MAKEKTKPNTKPEVEATTDTKKDPEEITIDPNKSVEDTVKEVVTETSTDDKPTDDKPSEDKPKEEPAPTLDEEAVKKQAKEELREELKNEVNQEVTQRIIEGITGKKVTDEPEYLQFIKNIQEKEKRDPTYIEALQFLKDATKTEVMAELKKEADEETETEKEAEETETKKNEEWNNYWNGQISDLEEATLIPKIADEKDQNDPGVKARIALFTAMTDYNATRKADGKPVTYSLKEIYYEIYSKRQVPGANAPITGINKGVSQDNKEYSYEDIHNPSMEKIVEENQR